MNGLRHLYQELVLDHGQNPRNRRVIENCDGTDGCQHRDGHNPLCGDKLTLYLKSDGATVEDLSFDGAGCAIFTASSSMLTELLKGKSVADAQRVMNDFLEMVTGGGSESSDADLGKLKVFRGVREFPARVKCATLPWRALESILASQGSPEVSVDSNDDQLS
jgi:nitrogen fixation NifU-like protein